MTPPKAPMAGNTLGGRTAKWLFLCAGIYLVLSLIAGIYLTERSLHLGRLGVENNGWFKQAVKEKFGGSLQDVSVTAKDGAVLKGWFAAPGEANGSTVILFHGIAGNRIGMAGYAQLMLAHGYSVLLPDARANGESGGEIATYGLLEAEDIRRWVSWLEEQKHPACVYGLGESYGASLLLESLAVEHRFCAVVAESAFSRFVTVAPERSAYFIGLSLSPVVPKLLTPAVWTGLGYARLFYGLNFWQANPIDAVRHSRTPVLLIHGELDTDILPWHSRYMAQENPDHVQLWIVPNVNHCATWQTTRGEFESRIVKWFGEHNQVLTP